VQQHVLVISCFEKDGAVDPVPTYRAVGDVTGDAAFLGCYDGGTGKGGEENANGLHFDDERIVKV
jgi:hypothetical protein